MNCSLSKWHQRRRKRKPLGKEHQRACESRLSSAALRARCAFSEPRSLGLKRNAGGKYHLKQHFGSKPIGNNYHEGKVKRTLKRELKVPETARREANETSFFCKIVVGIARDVSCSFRQRKLCARVQKPLFVDSLRCFINLVSALAAS